ncbi:ATP-binding cassette domain-containing protein [Umezawaea sp. Da 62-37]|uniref:ATP-binding cassette domain-containing protein n=1 Tax=Umezawaea sp. Da 62-37 TaxID=3075927 RepID=UPI0028F7105A|nr:ATP-binding cassette domain-containing protein [Umezawaea sp. Da 62-37]WNV84495.1 ATP-binding cassette domain-containing protein [Umezawaea sp. Da 62-37]
MDVAIQVEGLTKRYKEHQALGGIDLMVRQGSVLGLLGPNGAGKTTAVRVLATLLEPDGGRALVAGYDVVKQPIEVRRRIGLAGQYAAVDELLTGRENLVLLGTLLHLGRAGARRRAVELLERFDLTAAADRPVETYSGGMRRRLDLASCLIADPAVLFLDEPTTGLDPASRQSLWNTVRGLVSDGVTVLLTTQYLEEADYLADQIVVINSGKVIADGTPDELKRKVGHEWLEVVVALPNTVEAAVRVLAPIAVDHPTSDQAKGVIALQLRDGMDGIAAAAVALKDAGIDVADFAMRRPTLDDVFFNLVGHPAE